MSHRYRMFLYSTEQELPIVIELTGTRGEIEARTKIIAALDLIIFKAELWDGTNLVMKIDEDGLDAIRRQSETSVGLAVEPGTVH